MIEIDTNTPLPPPTVGRPPKYPFRSMEIGHSFAVPLAGIMRGSEDLAAAKLRVAASNWTRRTGQRFTIRTDRQTGVVRCWRTA